MSQGRSLQRKKNKEEERETKKVLKLFVFFLANNHISASSYIRGVSQFVSNPFYQLLNFPAVVQLIKNIS